MGSDADDSLAQSPNVAVGRSVEFHPRPPPLRRIERRGEVGSLFDDLLTLHTKQGHHVKSVAVGVCGSPLDDESVTTENGDGWGRERHGGGDNCRPLVTTDLKRHLRFGQVWIVVEHLHVVTPVDGLSGLGESGNDVAMHQRAKSLDGPLLDGAGVSRRLLAGSTSVSLPAGVGWLLESTPGAERRLSEPCG